MPSEVIIGLGLVLGVAGALWRLQISRLARRLFGREHRVRMVHGRWVIEATSKSRSVKYVTGGTGPWPALTYLMVESPIAKPFAIAGESVEGVIPDAARSDIDTLRRRDGFKRLDAVKGAAGAVPIFARVTWLHPGQGVMLRRFTRSGGDADFVCRDIEAMHRIADAVAKAD